MAEAAAGIGNFECTVSTGKWSLYGNTASTTMGLKVAIVTLKCIAMKGGTEVCVKDCVAGKSGVTGDIDLEADEPIALVHAPCRHRRPEGFANVGHVPMNRGRA